MLLLGIAKCSFRSEPVTMFVPVYPLFYAAHVIQICSVVDLFAAYILRWSIEASFLGYFLGGFLGYFLCRLLCDGFFGRFFCGFFDYLFSEFFLWRLFWLPSLQFF